MKFLLGTKLGMTQEYDAKGAVVPVTQISLGSALVTQLKTQEKDGYTALQVGFGEKRKCSKALRGHFKGTFKGPDGRGFRYVKEARVSTVDGVSLGDFLDASAFQVGELVEVTAHSKGRGFAGVVKRHHFHGHPSTHGHKDQERMPGSIGAGGNQHVFKGVRMAGRMGNERVTVKNLEVISVDLEKGVLTVKGAVPGARNGLVFVRAKGEMKFKKSEAKAENIVETEVKKNETDEGGAETTDNKQE